MPHTPEHDPRVPALRFESVTRRQPDGERQIAVLDRVSFAVREGAFMGLFGMRRSGKSTLMRLAAGIELPDEGTVSFKGRSLSDMPAIEREQLLRGPIALVSPHDWRPKAGELVVDQVALALASHGQAVADARRRARQALGRVAMLGRADRPASSLSLGERMRVLLARALVRRPRLLLVDEPALVPSLAERDEIAALLRAIACELYCTLIVASEELAALHGASTLMSISGGQLCSTEESPVEPEPERHGVVIALPRRMAPAMERSPL
jgi:ABC-type methionine transport system ATPase subunit